MQTSIKTVRGVVIGLLTLLAVACSIPYTISERMIRFDLPPTEPGEVYAISAQAREDAQRRLERYAQIPDSLDTIDARIARHDKRYAELQLEANSFDPDEYEYIGSLELNRDGPGQIDVGAVMKKRAAELGADLIEWTFISEGLTGSEQWFQGGEGEIVAVKRYSQYATCNLYRRKNWLDP